MCLIYKFLIYKKYNIKKNNKFLNKIVNRNYFLKNNFYLKIKDILKL